MTQPMEYERPLGLTLRAHMMALVEHVLPATARGYAQRGLGHLDEGDEIAAAADAFAVDVVDSIRVELADILAFTDREAEFHGHSLTEKLTLPIDVQTLTMQLANIRCRCEDQQHADELGLQFVIRRGGEVIADPIMSLDQGRELAAAIFRAVVKHGT